MCSMQCRVKCELDFSQVVGSVLVYSIVQCVVLSVQCSVCCVKGVGGWYTVLFSVLQCVGWSV